MTYTVCMTKKIPKNIENISVNITDGIKKILIILLNFFLLTCCLSSLVNPI